MISDTVGNMMDSLRQRNSQDGVALKGSGLPTDPGSTSVHDTKAKSLMTLEHEARSRSHTEPCIMPSNPSRAWLHVLFSPRSSADAPVSSVGETPVASTKEALVTTPTPEQRRLARRGGWIRFAVSLIQRLSVFIVFGALVVDVYLLQEAIFMEANGESPGDDGSVHGSRGFGLSSKPAKRKLQRPRLPLPLVFAHHALTSRGRPSNSSDVDASFHVPKVSSSREEARVESHIPRSEGPLTPLSQTFSTNASHDRMSSWKNRARDSVQGERSRHPEPSLSSVVNAGDSAPYSTTSAAADQQLLSSTLKAFNGQRVAVLVPYIGNELPAWWDIFARHASYNEGLIDWIVFCDEALIREDGPSNIRFVPMGAKRLSWLLSGVIQLKGPSLAPRDELAARARYDRDPGRHTRRRALSADGTTPDGGAPWPGASRDGAKDLVSERQRTAAALGTLLVASPYYLVEFKPALGWIFRDYLEGYTHWAFGDLDVLFGDMRRGWLEPNELRDFDIITFSFGDQYRAYLRGQLTIHRNTPQVNRIWMRCGHLTNYSERLEKFRRNHFLPLESAEGCYSLAAASDRSLKIKFSVKALSDVDEGGEAPFTIGQQVVIDGSGLVTQCPHLGYYDGLKTELPREPETSLVWSTAKEAGGRVFQDTLMMQDPVGPVTAVQRANATVRCEHWIKPEFQTCVEDVSRSHTLMLVGGQYLKQGFVNTARATGGRDCRAGAFYHFQDHKVNFKAWNTSPPEPSVHSGISAGPGGIVPMPKPGWRGTLGLSPPPQKSRFRLTRSYCLEWLQRKRSKKPRKGRAELVCEVKVLGTEVMTMVDTTATRPNRKLTSPSAPGRETVTLGGIGRPPDLAPFLHDALGWEGPKIFAMLLDSAEEEAAMRDLINAGGVPGISAEVLVVGLVRPVTDKNAFRLDRGSAADLPQKTLMNLIADLCETRYLLTLPGPARLSNNAFRVIMDHLLDSKGSENTSTSTADEERRETRESVPRTPHPMTLVVPLRNGSPPTPLSSMMQTREISDATTEVASAASAASAAAAATAASVAATKAVESARATIVAARESFIGEVNASASEAAEAAVVASRAAVSAASAAERSAKSATAAAAEARESLAALMQMKVHATAKSLTDVDVNSVVAFPPTPVKDEIEQLPGGGGQAPKMPIYGGESPQAASTPGSMANLRGRNDKQDQAQQIDGGIPKPPQREDVTAALPGTNPQNGGRRRLRSSQGLTGAAPTTREEEVEVTWDEEGQEEEWLKELLWAGAEMVGLVVDMWSPGAIFLRHVEEFGGAGCLDGAFALGLWHAGSSFRVATGVSMTPTGPWSTQQELEAENTTPGGPDPPFRRIDSCMPGQGIVKTAAIYSVFLRQVANVYRHPQSADIERGDEWDDPWLSSGAGSMPRDETTPGRSRQEDDGPVGTEGDEQRQQQQQQQQRVSAGKAAKGARPAIARRPFGFSFIRHPEMYDEHEQADEVLPEIGGGRARKGGWGGAWEDYVVGG